MIKKSTACIQKIKTSAWCLFFAQLSWENVSFILFCKTPNCAIFQSSCDDKTSKVIDWFFPQNDWIKNCLTKLVLCIKDNFCTIWHLIKGQENWPGGWLYRLTFSWTFISSNDQHGIRRKPVNWNQKNKHLADPVLVGWKL